MKLSFLLLFSALMVGCVTFLAGCSSREDNYYGSLAVGVGKQIKEPRQ